jgi:Ni/Co efflux regulator RcnB
MKLIVTIAAMSFLAASLAASSHADAQYTNNKPLTQRPLAIVPSQRVIPNQTHQSTEERENNLQQMQMYRQDQENFRRQMDSAAQQGSDSAASTESKRELRERLREMLDR